MMLLCRIFTKRTWKQILSYYGAVWPTGFGTGGSYDTLAINIISAEQDLGLDQDVAEVSIVFGTVLNKNCSTMSVLIVTIICAKLLNVPLSLTEILMLIPPVMILGLESPGIPGGAGYFMSPIIAVMLNVPDHGGMDHDLRGLLQRPGPDVQHRRQHHRRRRCGSFVAGLLPASDWQNERRRYRRGRARKLAWMRGSYTPRRRSYEG